MTNRTVVSAQYFLYFGVLGFYLPYFNLYCYHIGFGGVEIGALSSIRSLTVIVFPLLWGRLADRFDSRKPIYIACGFACTLLWAFYLLTVDFTWMALVTLFYGIFYSPLVSFLETFTMEVLGPEKKGYGKIRAWGSLSFILTVTLTGKLIGMFSAHVILYLILGGSALQALSSLKLPPASVERHEEAPDVNQSLFSGAMVKFLSCAFLMLASHGAYYGFFSIHLEKLGYDSSFIGVCWAVAVSAEILVMLKSNSIFSRFSVEKVLVFSMGVAAVRWFLLYKVESAAWLLVSQIAHSITYGSFHMSCILYMDRLSPRKSKTMGQAVNNAVSYGLGLTAGFLATGFLYERYDTPVLFLASGMTAVVAGILFLFPFGKIFGKRGTHSGRTR